MMGQQTMIWGGQKANPLGCGYTALQAGPERRAAAPEVTPAASEWQGGCTPVSTLCRLSSSRCQPGLAWRHWHQLDERDKTLWMWVCSPREVAGRSGGSACTSSSTETIVPQSYECLMALSRLSWLAAVPGQEEKKLFWSVAHAPAADRAARGGGISFPERRGALTLLSFANIKAPVKHKRCLWRQQHLQPFLQPAPSQLPRGSRASSDPSLPPLARWVTPSDTGDVPSANPTALGMFFLPPSW